MAVGPQSNPWSPPGTGGATADFTTYNPAGSGLPPMAGNNEVRVRGGSTGLDCNFRLEIKFSSASQLTFRVLHQSQPPTITAFDGAGAAVGSATAPPTQNVVSTLNISASGVVSAEVVSPADECILLEFCAT